MDWQTPFVDVFDFIGLGKDWSLVKKKGDVQLMRHKALGRNLLRIAGACPQENFVMIPKPNNRQLKTLGLNGRVVTVLFQILPDHLFLLHLDFTVIFPSIERKCMVRVSLSNLFEQDRRAEDSSLYIAVPSMPAWTLAQLDVTDLL